MKVIGVIEDQDVIKKILKHMGLWEVKPRTPPRRAKTQTLHTEPHIDYSDAQSPFPIMASITSPSFKTADTSFGRGADCSTFPLQTMF
jgi:hypothetical protein